MINREVSELKNINVIERASSLRKPDAPKTKKILKFADKNMLKIHPIEPGTSKS